MFRLSLLVLLASTVPAAADVKAGARVRLGFDGQSIVGEVVESTADAVVVTRGNQRVTIPVRSIKELEVSEGMQSRTVSWGFTGFFIGIVVGGIATLAIGPGGDENDYFLEVTLLPPALAGIAIGAIAGSFVQREEWHTVESKRINVVPRGRDGLTVVLESRF